MFNLKVVKVIPEAILDGKEYEPLAKRILSQLINTEVNAGRGDELIRRIQAAMLKSSESSKDTGKELSEY
jgi:hypothetical protein